MRRWVWLFPLLIYGTCARVHVYGQPANPSIVQVTSAPVGACTNGVPLRLVLSTGQLYSCQGGTWGVGGGGTATVNGQSPNSSGAVVISDANLKGTQLWASQVGTCVVGIAGQQVYFSDVGDVDKQAWVCTLDKALGTYAWTPVNGAAVLAKWVLPFTVIGSATYGNNGAVTLGTALNITTGYSGYWFVPANAISASTPSGWYYGTASSGTALTLFNNRYFAPLTVSTLPSAAAVSGTTIIVTDGTTENDCVTGGGSHRVLCNSNGSAWAVTTVNQPPLVPGSPTAFVTTGAGAIASGTSTIIGESYLMQGGVMGVSGQWQVEQTADFTNSAGTKTFGIKWNNNSNYTYTSTTNTRSVNLTTCDLWNNSAAAQLCAASLGGHYGTGVGTVTADTQNTALNTIISAQVGSGTATDNTAVQTFKIVLVRK